MLSQTPKDMAEYWIHKFASQNEAWASVWSHRYDEVEAAMAQLRDDCRTMGRKEAMDKFMAWLQSPEIAEGTDIPFHREAVAFAGVYWQNKAEYEASVKKQVAVIKSLPPKPQPPAPKSP
jgi:hypothetical protein